MFRLGVSARQPSRASEMRAHLKAQVARVMGLDEGAVVSITEISCGAAGCPDSEIVVLILREGFPTQAAKLHGPMDCIPDLAIADAFAARAEEKARERT
jgi:hypothetical protein